MKKVNEGERLVTLIDEGDPLVQGKTETRTTFNTGTNDLEYYRNSLLICTQLPSLLILSGR